VIRANGNSIRQHSFAFSPKKKQLLPVPQMPSSAGSFSDSRSLLLSLLLLLWRHVVLHGDPKLIEKILDKQSEN
jgi:hypothetical protein